MIRARTRPILWFLAGALSSTHIASRHDEHTLVRGIGNSGNRVYQGGPHALADALVEGPLRADVSLQTLREVWEAIQERARTGDPDAAAVVFAVAAHREAPADL